jgi:hypothetical protein
VAWCSSPEPLQRGTRPPRRQEIPWGRRRPDSNDRDGERLGSSSSRRCPALRGCAILAPPLPCELRGHDSELAPPESRGNAPARTCSLEKTRSGASPPDATDASDLPAAARRLGLPRPHPTFPASNRPPPRPAVRFPCPSARAAGLPYSPGLLRRPCPWGSPLHERDTRPPARPQRLHLDLLPSPRGTPSASSSSVHPLPLSPVNFHGAHVLQPLVSAPRALQAVTAPSLKSRPTAC